MLYFDMDKQLTNFNIEKFGHFRKIIILIL